MSDTDQDDGDGASSAAPLTRVALGSVVNVRSLPTRSVTRIEIEVPIESHVEATSLLFGKDVFVVVASALPAGAKYGISDGRPPTLEARRSAGTPATAPSAAPKPPREPRSTGPSAPMRGGLGLGRVEDTIDIVKWLGARCTEEAFQLWLGERTEAGAIAAVRAACGVQSRASIPRDATARALFFSKIYRPFSAPARRPFVGEARSSDGSHVAEDEPGERALREGLRELSRGG